MKKKIIAMIPARIGSERLKYKNLALINGKPLISYAINAVKKSKFVDEIYINSDDEIFSKIASRYKVNFYLRPKILGSSDTLSDDVVNDFMIKHKSELLLWINPIAPLQDYKDIDKCIKFFQKNKSDSLITVNDKKRHFYYKNKPVNFNIKKKFNKTQDLQPVEEFVYTIMMWRSKKFLNFYNKNSYALICGKFLTFPVKHSSSLIIKDIFDLKLAELLIKSKTSKVKYDKIMQIN